MTDPYNSSDATRQVVSYLENLIARTGLALTFEVQIRESCTTCSPEGGEASTASVAANVVTVEFAGPDTSLLVARNGELLHAIEHIAAKILGLEPEEHDRISFDAEGFKAMRNTELERMAEAAVESVRATGRPWSFAPMNSRERRMLHLVLSRSGLPTASSGMGPRRFVVLYPEGDGAAQPDASASGGRPAPSNAERSEAIRNRFRRRHSLGD